MKRKAKTKAKQRSLKHLRDLGWTCADVEKWLPPRGKMKFGVRVDAYGIADILACRPAYWFRSQQTLEWTISTEAPPMIALVQCFSDTGKLVGFESHREKILALPEAMAWIKSGGHIFLHGWKKRKAGWILTEEEVVLCVKSQDVSSPA